MKFLNFYEHLRQSEINASFLYGKRHSSGAYQYSFTIVDSRDVPLGAINVFCEDPDSEDIHALQIVFDAHDVYFRAKEISIKSFLKFAEFFFYHVEISLL